VIVEIQRVGTPKLSGVATPQGGAADAKRVGDVLAADAGAGRLGYEAAKLFVLAVAC
jgi:hypothetical protein